MSAIFGQFGIVYALLALSFLIFFHELGHFLAARFFGVKVEVFSIGFGKKIYSKKIGNTQYCLSLIPLGGYVKMKGQDDANPNVKSFDEDSYNTKAPWKRIIILFAGPFANFVLAFFLFIIVAHLGIKSFSPVIGAISNNSAAQYANLQVNDTIKEINGIKIKIWDDIKPIVTNSENKLIITIERNKEILHVELMPVISENKNMFNETIKEKLIGIQPKKIHVQYYRGFESISFAFMETFKASKLIILSLQKLIEGVVPAKEMGGVIAIVDLSADFAKAGIVPFLILVALISVNLGLLNLFPIPALDGGHIIFNIYEWIFKKPPNEKIFYFLTIMGWALLLSLMIFVTYNDIVRIATRNG